MKPKVKDTFSNICSNPISFAAKRLPNFGEALVTSASQATFDTFTGRVKLWFGDNPSAPAIFRDISKLPSIWANVYENNTVGYTDVKYDEGALWSHGIKAACKGSLLISYAAIINSNYNIPQDSIYSEDILASAALKNSDATALSIANFELTARAINYVCEIPNRFLSIATREKQRFEKSNPENKKEFWKFIAEDSEFEWWKEATGEALVKTTISDQLGEAVKHAGYIGWIRDSATLIDNYISISLGGNIFFTPEDDLYSKAFKTFSMFGLDYRTPFVFLSTLVVDWTAKFSTEMINAYTLGTPTRTCQDLTGIGIRELNEFTSNSTAVELFYNQTHSYISSYFGETGNNNIEL